MRRAELGRLAQLPFALARLLGQDVLLIRFRVQELFLGRDLEPLLGSLVGF